MSYPDVAALVRHPNVAAFLHVIRKGEAHDRDDDYTLINGGAHFTAPPWAHPFEGIPTTHGGKAAGAPQFLGTTWANLRKQHPDLLPDFSPPCQDIGAVLLIVGRDGMDALLAGDFDTAVWRCRAEWTSLPGAAENNPHWNLAVARAYYLAHGGQMMAAAVPESPPESATPTLAIPVPEMPQEAPMGALVPGLVLSLLQAFAPQAQAQLTPIVTALAPLVGGTPASPVPPTTPAPPAPATQDALLQFVQVIMTTALQVAGHQAPATATDQEKVAATAKVLADPALLQSVQEDAVDHFAKISPMLDRLAEYQKQEWDADEASMSAAAARNASTWDMTRTLVLWALGATSVIVVGLMGMAIAYAVRGTALPEMLLTLIVQTVTGILGFAALLFAFRFGSSRSSAAKDETMAQLAVKRTKA